jgi:hypothetical protein
LGNLAEIMKLIRFAQSEAPRMREEMAKLVVEGSAGGDMVKVRVNGKQEILDCKIEPEVFAERDAEMLEDLVVSATNQALQKARSALVEKVGQLPGGPDISGIQEMLKGLSGGAPET